MVGQKDCNLYVEEPSEYWARAGGLIMGEFFSFSFLFILVLSEARLAKIYFLFANNALS